jgi:predicted RNA-binding Zn ribbon-like protein
MPGQLGPVRFGGTHTRGRRVFELTGGRLCLDLANTLDERKTEDPRELLRTYQDLLDWGTQAGAVTGSGGAALHRYAERHPRAAAAALAAARALREAMFHVFAAAPSCKAVPPPALALLDDAVSRAAAVRRLHQAKRGFSWQWRMEMTDLESVLWPVAWSAGDLLPSADLDRVRLCAGAGCAWLFIDNSKNATRRWCDMSVCGNRAKARRHYRKISRQ